MGFDPLTVRWALLLLIGVAAFMLVYRRLNHLLTLLAAPFAAPSLTEIDALPADIAPVLAERHSLLLGAGFRPGPAFQMRDFQTVTTWGRVFRSDDQSTVALLLLILKGDGVCTTCVSYYSRLADGRFLETSAPLAQDSPAALSDPPEVMQIDGGTDPAQAWRLHQTALAEQPAGWEPLADPGSGLALVAEIIDRTWARRQASGWFKSVGDQEPGIYHLTLPAALRLQRFLVRAQRTQAAPTLTETAGQAQPLPLRFELLYLGYLRRIWRRRQRLTGGAGMAAASAVVFAVALVGVLNWVTVLLLLLALLLHEAGHLLVMRWRGFGNLSLLFVPLLGAVAAGEKRDATLADRVLVSLAGPLPGLLLAGAVTGAWLLDIGPLVLRAPNAPPSWLAELLVLTYVINFFNLLPIMPLDGGQVVDLTLLQRHPRVRAWFFLLGGIVLLGMGLYFRSAILALLAVGLLLLVPGMLKQAGSQGRLQVALFQRLAEMDDGDAAALLAVQDVLGADYPRRPDRFTKAEQLLLQVQSLRAPLGQRLAFLLLYLLLLVAAVPLMVYWLR